MAKIIKFGDIDIKKQKFHQHKGPIYIYIYIYITYINMLKKDAKKVKPLCIYLTKTGAYRIDFDETKYISFLLKDMYY